MYQGRVVGPLGNPNFLGGFLAMTLPFYLFTTTVLNKNRIINTIFILTNLIVIYSTQSRGAFLATAVVIGLYLYHRFKSKINVVYIATCIGLVLLIALLTVQRYSIWDNRGLIWSEGMKAVVQRPLTGYGQENFELIFPQERLVKVDNAHNIFLETVVSSGVFGLAVFLGILYKGVKQVTLPAKIALIAFIVRAFFNPLSIAEIAYFWFLLAL